MMKWGKKKPSSSPLARPAPSVSPISWLSRFKKMSIGSEPKPASTKPKVKKNSPPLSSTLRGSWNEGRFYGGDDDSDWRLSFGEERYQGQRSRVGLKSVWYDSDNELDVHFASSQSFKLGTRRQLPQHVEILQGNKDNKASKDQTPRKMTRRVLEEKLEEVERETDKADVNSTKSVEKYQLAPEPAIIQTMEKDSSSLPNSKLTKIGEECGFEAMNSKQTTAFSKEGKQRKSVRISRVLHRSRAKQSRKFRVYSPRKAKALEDIKKAKMQMNMKKTTTAFDSFAVVKSSVNPEQDFRDSMFEMIIEKGIRRAEDMEELLACYLTLNSDDHHELIIKVFRQVWFDLNQVCFDTVWLREYRSKCDGEQLFS